MGSQDNYFGSVTQQIINNLKFQVKNTDYPVNKICAYNINTSYIWNWSYLFYSVIQEYQMHWIFVFYIFYFNLKEKILEKLQIQNSKKKKYLYVKSVLLF